VPKSLQLIKADVSEVLKATKPRFRASICLAVSAKVVVMQARLSKRMDSFLLIMMERYQIYLTIAFRPKANKMV